MPTVARLKQTGDLLITGEVNELLPVVKKDLIAHLPLQEDTSVYAPDRNVLDYSTWSLGATAATGFSRNGTPTENQIIEFENPWGELDLIWGCINTDTTSDADGGWNSSEFPVDNTKVYRYSVWMRTDATGSVDGTVYFGCRASQVQSFSNAVNGNPYFAVMGVNTLPKNEWLLAVSYIYPHDATSANQTAYPAGLYRMNGTSITTPGTFKFLNTTTIGLHRTYLYYSTTPAVRTYFYQPRVEICDGSEPKISDLLAGVTNVNKKPTVTLNNPLFHNNRAWIGKRPIQIAIQENMIARYNNFGMPGTIERLNETFNGHAIYRLSFKVTDATKLSDFRTNFSNHGMYVTGTFQFKANTPYTYSFYWRKVNKTKMEIGGTPSNIQGWSGWRTEVVDSEWNQHVATRSINHATATTDHIFTGMRCSDLQLNETIYFDVACPMLFEAESHIQGFSNPIRPSTEESTLQIADPDYFKPPFSVNFFYRASERVDLQIGQAGSPKIAQFGEYYSNASLSLWAYEQKIRLLHKGDTGTGWSSIGMTDLTVDAAYQNSEHVYTIVFETTTLAKLYIDGNLVLTQTLSVPSSSFPFIRFSDKIASSQEMRAGVRDVSVYKRALTDADVKAIAGTKTSDGFSLAGKGELGTRFLNETGKGIFSKQPVDVVPLTSDLGYTGIRGLIEPNKFQSVTMTPEGSFASLNTINLLAGKLQPFTDKRFGYDGWSVVSSNHLKALNNSDDRGWLNQGSIPLDPSTTYTIQTLYWSTDGTLEDFYLQFNNDGQWPEGGMYFQPFSTSHAALVSNKRVESLGQNLYRYTAQFTTKATTTQIDQMFFDSDKIGHTVFVANVGLFKSKYGEFGADNGRSAIEFNLFESKLEWNWATDWTIAYWKKPIGTSDATNFTGFNLESIGANSNSVGGSYMWQGKSQYANEAIVQITNGSSGMVNVAPSDYFNEWQLVVWTRRGGTFEIRHYSPKLGKLILTRDMVVSAANAFVCQHGYDFKLGGWDGTNACASWYRDVMFFKESMSGDEMDQLYKRAMSLRKGEFTEMVVSGTLIESARI